MRQSRIIIVGYGPAGMACAIQMKRMGLQPLVIEKACPGGMLFNANRIENYPGFPNGISGDELAGLFTEHASGFNIEVVKDDIQLINFEDGIFQLTGIQDAYESYILVISTGTVPVIPDNCPMELVREGLIHFDISRFKHLSGKTIGIIGAGDAAFDYSLTLSQNNNSVFIFNRGVKIMALKVLSDRVFTNKMIKYSDIISLKSLELLEGNGLKAIFNSASGNREYLMDYLIFATGRKPANVFFNESLKSKMPGLLSKHRLYLIGDIMNGPCRQVSVAVGDGVRTAMEIFRNEGNQ